MFRMLSNQHYQHPTNQKLSSWANTVFQNHGVCGQAFPSLPRPSPSPAIPFFVALVPMFLTNSRTETLATQASQVTISGISIHTHNMTQFFLFVTNSATVFSLTAVYWVLECFSIFSFVFWKLFVMVVLLHDKWNSVCEKLWFLTVTHEITIHVNKLTFSG